MRMMFSIMRRILSSIFKKLIYAIFLILLFIRRLVLIFLNFFGRGLALFLFFIFMEYTVEAAPYEHQTAMVIGAIVLIFCCLYANDAYERLL